MKVSSQYNGAILLVALNLSLKMFQISNMPTTKSWHLISPLSKFCTAIVEEECQSTLYNAFLRYSLIYTATVFINAFGSRQ